MLDSTPITCYACRKQFAIPVNPDTGAWQNIAEMACPHCGQTQVPLSWREPIVPDCPVCGEVQSHRGVQGFGPLGTEVDLYHCMNTECEEYQMTRSYNKRVIEKHPA
jgi:hypothetical protein